MLDSSARDGRLVIRVLGDVGACRGSRQIQVTSSAERRVLARLVAAAGSPVTTSTLIDVLWPEEPPATARASLQNHVSRLRSALGADTIVSTGSGYRLSMSEVDIDVIALSTVIETIDRDGEPASQLKIIEEVGEFIVGEPFAELAEEPWARPAALRAREQQLLFRERRLDAMMRLGRFDEAVPDAQGLCEEEALRESAALLLMRALDGASRVGDAVRVAAMFRLRTVEETGLEPSARLFDCERELLGRDHDVGDQPLPVRRLPRPPRSIVGRTVEIAELRSLVAMGRVVTLCGPGGVGKTRLAIAVADDLAANFHDGVYFVDLALVTSEGQVGEAFASACGVSVGLAGAFAAVVRSVADRHALVVIDCCEHVVEGVAAFVADLVERCPAVSILATSRERLHIDVEDIYDVQPLGRPAVQLFEERAASVRRGFRLDVKNRAIVERICERVDGLPLGIELAAAHIAALDPATILLGLDSPLDFLRDAQRNLPDRHRGLSAAVEWSWALLDRQEQILLRRASVFVAPFTLPALTAVASDDELPGRAIQELIASLVRKSLVSATIDDGVMRYRMLDTVRHFASDRLWGSDDSRPTMLSMMQWSIGVLDLIDSLCHSNGEAEGAALRRREVANIGVALDWALAQQETDLAMRCLPAIVGAGVPGLGSRLKRFELLPEWEVSPFAPYLTSARALHFADFDTAVRAAVACDGTDLPNFLKARAHMAAIQVSGLNLADPAVHIARLRELAAHDAEPRVAWAHALGEHWALPLGDPTARDWALRAMEIGRLAGLPGLEAIAEYLALQTRITPDTLVIYRRLRETFKELDRGVFVDLCEAAIEYGDPSGRSVVWWLRETEQAVATSPKFVRNFGNHRAHLIAGFGREEAAASVFGSLDRMRADKEFVSLFGDDNVRNELITAHPLAYAQGRLLTAEQTAALVVGELRRLAEVEEAD